MAMFNSYVSHYQRVLWLINQVITGGPPRHTVGPPAHPLGSFQDTHAEALGRVVWKKGGANPLDIPWKHRNFEFQNR